MRSSRPPRADARPRSEFAFAVTLSLFASPRLSFGFAPVFRIKHLTATATRIHATIVRAVMHRSCMPTRLALNKQVVRDAAQEHVAALFFSSQAATRPALTARRIRACTDTKETGQADVFAYLLPVLRGYGNDDRAAQSRAYSKARNRAAHHSRDTAKIFGGRTFVPAIHVRPRSPRHSAESPARYQAVRSPRLREQADREIRGESA